MMMIRWRMTNDAFSYSFYDHVFYEHGMSMSWGYEMLQRFLFLLTAHAIFCHVLFSVSCSRCLRLRFWYDERLTIVFSFQRWIHLFWSWTSFDWWMMLVLWRVYEWFDERMKWKDAHATKTLYEDHEKWNWNMSWTENEIWNWNWNWTWNIPHTDEYRTGINCYFGRHTHTQTYPQTHNRHSLATENCCFSHVTNVSYVHFLCFLFFKFVIVS